MQFKTHSELDAIKLFMGVKTEENYASFMQLMTHNIQLDG